eukprot:CAMPEP_0168551570 /NCGR_PEP_ID=MMETSP0413-20121227/6243_1 /TAXON_ID=136452 /ORGANISM="Filamoeba nolandi, Strain NC-AS-23-1" /LENGTH=388 /DNA_ID=CAMNT_0008582105 /DNA_START=50 /DNA_END=1212 /DNA_ORIENTATION=+
MSSHISVEEIQQELSRLEGAKDFIPEHEYESRKKALTDQLPRTEKSQPKSEPKAQSLKAIAEKTISAPQPQTSQNNNNTTVVSSPSVNLNAGATLPKCPTSHCVINIVPPRDQWDAIQRIRTLYVPDCRCGPHITFIDPFIELEYFPQAAAIMQEALKNFPPFQIKFDKFNYFVHNKSATLYLEPETEDPNVLQNLMQEVLKVFPQCNDSVKRGKGTGYVPHLSIAKFPSEESLKQHLNQIKQNWQPISFLCTELYILNRVQGDPFEVKHIVKLGGDTSPSHFGPSSGEDNSQLRRTLLIAGFPRNKLLRDHNLTDFMEKAGFKPSKCELLYNPGGQPRTCGIVEFSTEEEMLQCVSTYNYQPFQAFNATVYVKPLPSMMFPDVIGSA